ncbi:MAG: RimK family alpha-L-glutamate ligase [Nanoarchaeota archaeon]|nr:RimK family alpha-L-glutamate ligase [Nanoarchaeota archaeon]MBU4451845.1 RimK family alpha-L-glutamate ligase [Nanoarchaeota archaeon]MCG2724419.1 RimK family alpha-L-glutamate ligase [archaeon]
MPKKLLVAAPKNMAVTTRLIIEEAKKLFKVHYAPIKDVALTVSEDRTLIEHNSRDLTDIDYLMPKVDSFRAYYGYQIVKAFEFYPEIIKPYSPRAIQIAHDKFLTMAILSHNKIPVPKTYLVKTKKGIKNIASKIIFPVMVKLMNGSGGIGVMYVENEEAMESIIESMNLLKQEALVQEYIENPGEDIRVLVAGGEVLGAMKRIAAPGEKRANIKAGGHGIKYLPTSEISEISFKSAEAIEAKICAVDIVEGTNGAGPKVIEVNINPGIRGLTAATGTNIAKKIVEYAYMECRK